MQNKSKAIATLLITLTTIALAATPGKVKIVSFTSLDGNISYAKVISEDRRQLTVSYPNKGQIITRTFERQNIIPDTLATTTMLEFDYWNQLAEYFKSKTWDYQNDPDEFAQAVKCYENALKIVEASKSPEHELAVKLKDQIKNLKADKVKWTKQAQQRAKEKDLELRATFDTKLAELTEKINTNTEALSDIKTQLDRIQQLASNNQKLTAEIAKNAKTVDKQIDRIIADIDSNSRQIYYLWDKSYDYKYYYYRKK